MYTRRNFKKATNKTPLKKTTYISSHGYGKYNFPYLDDVPPSIYFSEIDSATMSHTKNGSPAIEVYYVMRDAYICSGIVNGTLPPKTKKKLYYIIQKYPEGTPHYAKFVAAMSNALGLDDEEKFSLDDIVGITELVCLTYGSSSAIGGFSDRKPFKEDDFYSPSLHPEDPPVVETDVHSSQIENIDEPDYDEDDDFDDFLDDDDD